jgi:hypothetical protein
MKRILTGLSILCFCAVDQAAADTLQLLDGRVIQGKIIEQNERQYVIRDEKGRLNRYFKDQVTQATREEDAAALTVDASQFENIPLEKSEQILRLLEANGTRKNLQSNIDATLKNVPANRQEELKKLFNINGIISELVPIYDRLFTPEDLAGMIAFYESPAGQKMLGVSTTLIKEVTLTTVNYFQKKLSPANQ